MGREGRMQRGGHLNGRDVVSQEQREQTLRSPVSQTVEVSTGSQVYSEGE